MNSPFFEYKKESGLFKYNDTNKDIASQELLQIFNIIEILCIIIISKHNEMISDNIVEKIVKRYNININTFQLSSCNNISNWSINHIIKYCNNIKNLDISYSMGFISSSVFIDLAFYCNNLKCLDISNCGLDDNIIINMINTSKSLRSIIIYDRSVKLQSLKEIFQKFIENNNINNFNCLMFIYVKNKKELKIHKSDLSQNDLINIMDIINEVNHINIQSSNSDLKMDALHLIVNKYYDTIKTITINRSNEMEISNNLRDYMKTISSISNLKYIKIRKEIYYNSLEIYDEINFL